VRRHDDAIPAYENTDRVRRQRDEGFGRARAAPAQQPAIDITGHEQRAVAIPVQILEELPVRILGDRRDLRRGGRLRCRGHGEPHRHPGHGDPR
jgi:hypothetical protein